MVVVVVVVVVDVDEDVDEVVCNVSQSHRPEEQKLVHLMIKKKAES